MADLRSMSWQDLSSLLVEMCASLDARGFTVPDPQDLSLVATLERAGWARSVSAEVGFAIATGRHVNQPVPVAENRRIPGLGPLEPIKEEDAPPEVRAVVNAFNMTERAVDPKRRPS